MNRNLTYAAIFVFALSATGCVNREAQTQAKRTQTILSDQVIPVQVELAVGKPFVEMLEITGSLTSADDTQVGARVAGKITQVFVKDGDSVQAGQLIAIQDAREGRSRTSQARAQLDGALASLRQAEAEAVVGPRRSLAAVRAARAQLATAESNLLKARNGSRIEERRQAEAQLQAAKTGLDIAKKDRDRGQILLEQGAISERDFDRYRQAYANALAQYEGALENTRIVANATRPEDIRSLEGQVAAAREQLQSALASQRLDSQYADRVDQARAQVRSAQDQIDLAQQTVGDAEIRAPFAGRIAGKPLQIGSYAGPGTQVVRLIGTEGIYFEGQIPEVKINSIRTGMPVTIQLDALAGRFYTGTIAAINPQAESLGRLYKVRVMLSGAPGDLKGGMFARAKVELNRRENVVTVPSGALLGEPGSHFVYVANGTKAAKRMVETGLAQAGRTEVTGISEGDKVIISGQTQVKADTPIRIEESKGA